jgi:hypothetical protein
MTDVAIDDFLRSLGLAPAAARRARALLEAERITNPRKSRISEAKLDRARQAIDARFARFCSSCAGRTDAGGREVIAVPASACTRCGGSRNSRALAEMAEACAAAGIARVVVVGGSPDVRRELGSVRGALELRLIDGTERRTRAAALRDLDWADLVVIGGSSELGHKVSSLYTRAGCPTPVVTVAGRPSRTRAAAPRGAARASGPPGSRSCARRARPRAAA